MTMEVQRPVRASINELCDLWKVAATREGGIAIGGETESYRLRANGVSFHDLDYDDLRQAAVGLTGILLLPGLSTIIDLDHVLLWSWCAELLLGRSQAPFASSVDPEIRELAATTFHTALANVTAPSHEAFERARQASRLIEPNAHEYLVRAHRTLPYLAFPPLEAVARSACAEYVTLNGRVIKPFKSMARGATRSAPAVAMWPIS
ncbi:hypothetical protein [Terrabacter sp. 2YAF2]|uniref:hypothetical protein n=1 Tax=Terrabacter sp. 2YAF2 TaxID=3233026 RepID=UPI003F9B13DA